MAVDVTTHRSPSTDDVYISAKISSFALAEQHAPTAILRLVCEKIAERYVQENYATIAAKLDPQAIANLAIAEAAKKIAEEIQSRPVIIKEIETQIYERGIFGGTKRVR